MNKYISPAMEIEELEATDIILTSENISPAGYEIKPLEGVDTGDDKSAVIDVYRWF